MAGGIVDSSMALPMPSPLLQPVRVENALVAGSLPSSPAEDALSPLPQMPQTDPSSHRTPSSSTAASAWNLGSRAMRRSKRSSKETRGSRKREDAAVDLSGESFNQATWSIESSLMASPMSSFKGSPSAGSPGVGSPALPSLAESTANLSVLDMLSLADSKQSGDASRPATSGSGISANSHKKLSDAELLRASAGRESTRGGRVANLFSMRPAARAS